QLWRIPNFGLVARPSITPRATWRTDRSHISSLLLLFLNHYRSQRRAHSIPHDLRADTQQNERRQANHDIHRGLSQDLLVSCCVWMRRAPGEGAESDAADS